MLFFHRGLYDEGKHGGHTRPHAFLLLGEHVESLDKPVGERVLQAMAQAYPDPVDLYLLSMVMGSDQASLEATTASLVDTGLAQARVLVDGAQEHLAAPCITDKGMLVADGMAANAQEAAALLDKLEADALRQLLACRIRASHLPAQQADALRASLATVDDTHLVDAAKVWAHQAVSDWRAFFRVMGHGTAGASGAP